MTSPFYALKRMNSARRGTLFRWLVFDAAVTLLCQIAAYSLSARALSFDFFGPSTPFLALLMVFLVALLMLWRGLYSVQARYLSLWEGVNLFGVCTAAAVLFAVLNSRFGTASVKDPAMPPVLFLLLMTVGLTSLRVTYRALALMRSIEDGEPRPRPRTIVVGAGDAGEMVVREMNKMRRPTHHIIGIVDDDDGKYGTRLHGVPLLGKTEHLPTLVQRHQVTEILIALPSVDGIRMREVLDRCMASGARTRTLPPITDLIAGRLVVNQVRDVDIADLLRRPPVAGEFVDPVEYLNAETILITGGGGSIGGELARQVGRMRPAHLILVGKGENSIFEVEQQLIREIGLTPIAVVADVRDRAAMEAVFEKYAPSVVFHAAAHKHVPLMQLNPIEAIRNNVFGTLEMVELSIRYGAKKFILISTDKAVNPGSIMGATKRVAEMIVRAKASRAETDFAVVRFGNVLGSRGSLIPNIKAQIQSGGPVRITHPDMTRFFMTIPEAVQLIVQAGAFGKFGEIFILDMGNPISVLDLARDVIKLHGLEPDVTMPVVFTGPRPGEKIHEDLVYDYETLRDTPHPKIRVAESEVEFEWPELQAALKRLARLCDDRDADVAKQCLMSLAYGKPQLELSEGLAVVTAELPREVVVSES